ncbi:alpha/beta fold hydrolase [Pseudoroseomonas globiformis]|uniref:Alpha/beta fold hydrolase n=1 Tax=Teichococcus globiformis TaxID=2307229 RepID=A0ABV7G3C5_9PROT
MHPILKTLEASSRRSETPCGTGRLVWHEWGEGKPLILLHGGAGSWRHWARNIQFLSHSWRVLAPDTPGLGESDLPPEGTDLWGLADILAEGIAMQVKPGGSYDLVGFSFGAVIASHIAARSAAGLQKVVLAGPGALGLRRSETPLVSIRDRAGPDRVAAHRTNLASLMLADPAAIDELALEIQAWNSDHARFRSRNIVSDAAVREALPSIRVPVHAIFGERDAVAYPYVADRVDLIRSIRPNADVRVIPQAGHWVAYEAADTFNAILTDML